MKTWTRLEVWNGELVEVTYSGTMTAEEWAVTTAGRAFIDRAEQRQQQR